MSRIVGAPAVQDIQDVNSIVSGMDENKVIQIHNPLPDDFRVIYARSGVLDSVPLSEDQRRVRQLAGLPLTKEGPTVGHQQQELIFKAGDTRNFPGDIGQQIVRKLTTYIIQTRNEGNDKWLVADPVTRQEVEKQLVKSISDTVNVLSNISPEEYTKRQLNELNPAIVDDKQADEPEKAFPTPPDDMPNPPVGKGQTYDPKPKTNV